MYSIKIFKISSVCKHDYVIWGGGGSNFVQFSSKCFTTKNKTFNYFYTVTSGDDSVLPEHVKLRENLNLSTIM